MGQYFSRAEKYLRGPELQGTTDWGDQMCLNLYCHSQPDRWSEISQAWNYCVHDRAAGEVFVDPAGCIRSRRGQAICVAHGNARSLRQFSLMMDVC